MPPKEPKNKDAASTTESSGGSDVRALSLDDVVKAFEEAAKRLARKRRETPVGATDEFIQNIFYIFRPLLDHDTLWRNVGGKGQLFQELKDISLEEQGGFAAICDGVFSLEQQAGNLIFQYAVTEQIGVELFKNLARGGGKGAEGTAGLGRSLIFEEVKGALQLLTIKRATLVPGRSETVNAVDLFQLKHDQLMTLAHQFIYGKGATIESNPTRAAILYRLAYYNPTSTEEQRIDALVGLSCVLFRGETRVHGIGGVEALMTNPIAALSILCQAYEECNRYSAEEEGAAWVFTKLEQIQRHFIFILAHLIIRRFSGEAQTVLGRVLNQIDKVFGGNLSLVSFFAMHAAVAMAVSPAKGNKPSVAIQTIQYLFQTLQSMGLTVAQAGQSPSVTVCERVADCLSDLNMARAFLVKRPQDVQPAQLLPHAQPQPVRPVSLPVLGRTRSASVSEQPFAHQQLGALVIPDAKQHIRAATPMPSMVSTELSGSAARAQLQWDIETNGIGSKERTRQQLILSFNYYVLAIRASIQSHSTTQDNEEDFEGVYIKVKEKQIFGLLEKLARVGMILSRFIRINELQINGFENEGAKVAFPEWLQQLSQQAAVKDYLIFQAYLDVLQYYFSYENFAAVKKHFITPPEGTTFRRSVAPQGTMPLGIFEPNLKRDLNLSKDDFLDRVKEREILERQHVVALSHFAALWGKDHEWFDLIQDQTVRLMLGVMWRFIALLPFDTKGFGYSLDTMFQIPGSPTPHDIKDAAQFLEPHVTQFVERLKYVKAHLSAEQFHHLLAWMRYFLETHGVFNVLQLNADSPILGLYKTYLECLDPRDALFVLMRKSFDLTFEFPKTNWVKEKNRRKRESEKWYPRVQDGEGKVSVELKEDLVSIFTWVREELAKKLQDEYPLTAAALCKLKEDPLNLDLYLDLDKTIVHEVTDDNELCCVLRLGVNKWLIDKNSVVMSHTLSQEELKIQQQARWNIYEAYTAKDDHAQALLCVQEVAIQRHDLKLAAKACAVVPAALSNNQHEDWNDYENACWLSLSNAIRELAQNPDLEKHKQNYLWCLVRLYRAVQLRTGMSERDDTISTLEREIKAMCQMLRLDEAGMRALLAVDAEKLDTCQAAWTNIQNLSRELIYLFYQKVFALAMREDSTDETWSLLDYVYEHLSDLSTDEKIWQMIGVEHNQCTSMHTQGVTNWRKIVFARLHQQNFVVANLNDQPLLQIVMQACDELLKQSLADLQRSQHDLFKALWEIFKLDGEKMVDAISLLSLSNLDQIILAKAPRALCKEICKFFAGQGADEIQTLWQTAAKHAFSSQFAAKLFRVYQWHLRHDSTHAETDMLVAQLSRFNGWQARVEREQRIQKLIDRLGAPLKKEIAKKIYAAIDADEKSPANKAFLQALHTLVFLDIHLPLPLKIRCEVFGMMQEIFELPSVVQFHAARQLREYARDDDILQAILDLEIYALEMKIASAQGKRLEKTFEEDRFADIEVKKTDDMHVLGAKLRLQRAMTYYFRLLGLAEKLIEALTEIATHTEKVIKKQETIENAISSIETCRLDLPKLHQTIVSSVVPTKMSSGK